MAVDQAQERHRASHLKQQNKKHKNGRHRSKGEIETAAKGRVSVTQCTAKFKALQSRKDRRHQASQLRTKKRDEVLSKKRQLGTSSTSPFLVSVVPLTADVDPRKVYDMLEKCDPESKLSRNSGFADVLHISVPRFKQRFSFLTPDPNDMYAVLDSLKVADTVLFITSTGETPIDEVGELTLTSCLAQGLPTTVLAILNLDSLPIKKRSDFKTELQQLLSKWLPEEKVIGLDKDADVINLLRRIGGQKQRHVAQRDSRPHLLAETVEYISSEKPDVGMLKVSGYLRGQTLSANSLVHIPGWGSFQIDRIEAPPDPHPLDANQTSDVKLLQVADCDKQESLTSENNVDEMDCEQTWPTQEELQAAEKERKKLVKKIPKGMSEYQAAWIPDCDAESAGEDYIDEEDGDEMDVESEEDSDKASEPESDEEEFEVNTVEGQGEMYDKTVDMEEEEDARNKLKRAKEDKMFPDEVDTPQDLPARLRFQKYRGLASFRTSPWDPKENLPRDYARLFQFENFDRARKRVFREVEEQSEGAMPGWHTAVYIKDVPKALYLSYASNTPIIVYGMLPNEQKMSVINIVLKRTAQSSLAKEPIKSKEELVFQCGYRRFKCNPVFSQHTNGTKHKFERFFQPDSTVVASIYAPIIFPPASVLVYKEKEGHQDIVATGKVMSVNPDRMVIKRVVLSGHPYKVNKKSAVIRFMFFNKEDIDWFKSVELKSKYGRRGHIRESLGTHGHMKCVFDGQLKSQDTILLYLYKRVFPKWSYQPLVNSPYMLDQKLPTIQEEEEMQQ